LPPAAAAEEGRERREDPDWKAGLEGGG